MKSATREVLSECLPPIIRKLFNRFAKRSGYFGNYSEWRYACNDSTGYDSSLILRRVHDAVRKVKRNAVYERDSVIFEEVQYFWPLLAGLLWIASRSGNRLNLIDFGGSLGSSYFQNRLLLSHLQELSWSVVEQENFVRCGREHFEDQTLRFYYTIDECISAFHPDVILLSSVLPYLELPYELLTAVLRHKFPYIIIDRTPMLQESEDRLTVQQVPAEIYKASYPAWILGREKILSLFASDYDLVSQFEAIGGAIFLGNEWCHDTGFIFKRKDIEY